MEDMIPQELAEFMAKNPKAVIVDVRFEHERKDYGYVAQSHHIPILTEDWDVCPNFVENVAKVASPDVPIVFICRSGNRSCVACELVMENGYKQIFNLKGGYVALSDVMSGLTGNNYCSLSLPDSV